MAMFSKRPVALAHLSDEQAASALSKHFGNIVEAAKELGVDRKDLRRLTWSNPAILDAAHERMELFILVRRSEVMTGLWSEVGSVRRRAIDRIAANPGLFAEMGSAWDLLTPAPRVRHSGPSDAERAQAAIERELAAEWELERAAEGEREAALERALEQERSEVMVERPPLRRRPRRL